jgi:hypothetical protein
MSKLLKEAIADAKAVRETAMASAKIALEEAFTPRLQSMLSARLAEEAEDEEMTEEEEMEMTQEGEEGTDGTPDPGPAIEEEDDMEMEEDLDLESIIRELEGEMEEPTMEEEEEADATVTVEPSEPVEEEEDVNIEEIIRALREEDDDDDDDDAPVTEGEDEDADPVAEGEDSEELKEAYKVIRFMKSKLNEVNLLNAKLLFSNKLFRNYALNESQKMKVIENFDRAATIREVKLVYSTLCESFGSVVKKKQIKESYASKPAGKSTAPKKEILSEGFELAARWKKLANLK